MKGISVFLSFLEVISEFSRILAFGFRLFGNIFAGEVVLATMAFLVPFFLPLPFYALEVFVGVIQALVFTMLALVFFTMATISHGHEEHGDSHGHAAHGHENQGAIAETQIVDPPVA
jgi:F-type H+-transporting ATPase subunit a